LKNKKKDEALRKADEEKLSKDLAKK